MMNSKSILITILVISTLLLLKKEEIFQDKFALLTLPIKESYLNFSNDIHDEINRFSNQSKSIENLKKENILLRKYLYQQKMSIIQLEQLNGFSQQKFDLSETIIRVQTISYKKLNDFSQIYLTKGNELKKDKIYGLIQKNVVAGIAIKNEGPLKGVLLSNPECQFSTFIGRKNTPGIAKGIDAQSMEINFIPKWSKIAIGDKVITSGLDNIFLPNIPVGDVTKVITQSTYKTAIIKTHADVLHPNFFYLVKEVLQQPEEINITKIKLDNNITD